MPTPKFTHVIFDLDGTLLNTLDDIADAANWACEQMGWPTHSAREYCHMIGNGIENLIRLAAPECGRTPELLEKAREQYFVYYTAHRADKTGPYAGLPQVVDAIKAAGASVAVLTNKSDASAVPMMEHYYPGVFPVVQGSMPGIPLKPDPTPVYAVMERMGADGEHTLFVGDTEVDIQTAKNSGLAVCAVLWGFRTKEELDGLGADYTAARPDDLMNIILGE